MSELALKLIAEEKKNKTGKLDLGRCGLNNYLPEELFDLTWLKELVVSGFYLDLSNGTIFRSKSNDEENKFNDYDLPNKLSNLENLEKIVFGNVSFSESWNINDVRPLRELRNLQILYLHNNQINDVSSLRELRNLQILSLDNNQINDVSSLRELRNLQILSLDNNQINDVSPLRELRNLQSLSLDNNQINDVSPLRELSNLQILYLDNNQINDVSPLRELRNLKSLTLDNNQINDVSPLRELRNLKSLTLDNNQINDVSPLRELRNLQILYLNNNQINNVNPLRELRNLQSLYLSRNEINDFSPLLPLYKNGCKIEWEENPVETPPESVLKVGNEAVVNYLEQLKKQGSENLYEARIIIAGEGKSGKTTLFRKLTEENVKVPDDKQESTHGINIYFGKEFQHKSRDGKIINANIWDFGGQDIQTYLHQYFFASKSLFLLVTDGRSENNNFDYWFEIISRLCEGIKVIIINNIRDRVTATRSFNPDDYKKRFPKLEISHLEVNFGEDDRRWDLLIETIEKQLSEIDRVNEAIPALWKPIKEELFKQKKKGKKYIDFSFFESICNDNGLTKEKDQDLCLDYLHWLGYALHYEDSGLNEKIFINPEWITKGLYEVLRKDNFKEGYKGRFEKKDIFKVWEEKGYNKTERNILLGLLTKDKFEVCYQIGKSNKFLVPILVDNHDNHPKYAKNNKYTIKFEFPFMPFGFFSRLIVRLYSLIWDNHIWLTGVYIRNDEKTCITFLKHIEGDRIINIDIYGEVKERINLLGMIRSEMFHIRKELYPSIEIIEKIPCTCDYCNKSVEPYYHSRTNLDKIMKRHKFESQCQESGELVSILTLLNSIVSEEDLKRQKVEWEKDMGERIKIDVSPNFELNQKTEVYTDVETKVSINIDINLTNELISTVEALKDELVNELEFVENIDENDKKMVVKDVENFGRALESIVKDQSENNVKKNKGKIETFFKKLNDGSKRLGKCLQVIENGKDLAKQLIGQYNKVASTVPILPDFNDIVTSASKWVNDLL